MKSFIVIVLSLACLSQTVYSMCPCMQGMMNKDLSYLSGRPGTGSFASSSAGSFAGNSGSYAGSSAGSYAGPAMTSYQIAPQNSGGANLGLGGAVGGILNGAGQLGLGRNGLNAKGAIDLLGGTVKGAGQLGLTL